MFLQGLDALLSSSDPFPIIANSKKQKFNIHKIGKMRQKTRQRTYFQEFRSDAPYKLDIFLIGSPILHIIVLDPNQI